MNNIKETGITHSQLRLALLLGAGYTLGHVYASKLSENSVIYVLQCPNEMQ